VRSVSPSISIPRVSALTNPGRSSSSRTPMASTKHGGHEIVGFCTQRRVRPRTCSFDPRFNLRSSLRFVVRAPARGARLLMRILSRVTLSLWSESDRTSLGIGPHVARPQSLRRGRRGPGTDLARHGAGAAPYYSLACCNICPSLYLHCLELRAVPLLTP